MQAKEGYFVIMVSALVLGGQNGFVIGAITALVSNIFAYGVSSFFFDLAHGLSNMFFLGIFAPSWIQTIRRFKEKYGLFPEIS